MPFASNSLNKNLHAIFLETVCEKIIYYMLISLKKIKSFGYDSITTKMLKMCARGTSTHLHIINLFFGGGPSTEQLKLCIVESHMKKDDKKSPSNYRPVALIPSLSKIFQELYILH